MDVDTMTMMMQQVEKLPDFYEYDFNKPSSFQNHQPQIYNTNNNNIIQPAFQPQTSFISFMGNPITNTEHTPDKQKPEGFILPSDSDISSNTFSASPSNMAAMREMIFRIAVMQPIQIDPESVKAPKRRNVKISKDPQSVAARHRRERISERIRILQRLVPGGTKMDTASMLDEAIHYVKFLKKQIQTLEEQGNTNNNVGGGFNNSLAKACYQLPSHTMVGNLQMLR